MADLLKKTSTGYIWEQGGSIFDILENAQLDIAGVVAYVQKLGYKEILLQGHSLGPHKISYYLTHTPNNPVSKVILLTTADVRYQFDCSVPDWEKYSLIAKKMIDEGKGKELMPVLLWSNCPISAASFWNYTNPHTNCFVFNGTHPEQEFRNFNKIKLPMLIVNPENDAANGIDPYEFLKLIKKNSASIQFEGHVVKNAVHNFLSKENELSEIVIKWLKHQQSR
jgi:pimeloyl-ACP methyl ester carboxylesterase